MKFLSWKELKWRIPVLVLVFLVVMMSVFDFFANSDIGGSVSTGGGPALGGGDRPVITQHAVGTKISFIINSIDADNAWYIDGGESINACFPCRGVPLSLRGVVEVMIKMVDFLFIF